MIRYLLISFLFTEVMATSAKTLICSTYKPRNLNLKKKNHIKKTRSSKFWCVLYI